MPAGPLLISVLPGHSLQALITLHSPPFLDPPPLPNLQISLSHQCYLSQWSLFHPVLSACCLKSRGGMEPHWCSSEPLWTSQGRSHWLCCPRTPGYFYFVTLPVFGILVLFSSFTCHLHCFCVPHPEISAWSVLPGHFDIRGCSPESQVVFSAGC